MDIRMENPAWIQEGCLPPRATLVPALHEGVYFKNKEESELIQLLNGDFAFCYQQRDCIPDFYREDYVDAEWDTLSVPSMWQYHGYGAPVYPNVEYPIPFAPPYVCSVNPVGYYRKKFNAKKTGHTILYFGGVDNVYFVYLNGEYIGFSKGSRLPAEFDVSGVIREGENLLCVKVFTYSDATYLENQDMLLANGIFRDVMLYHLSDVYIWDYFIRTEGNKICLDMSVRGESLDGYSIRVQANGCVQEKKAEEEIHFEFEIEDPKRWNAEMPELYPVQMELRCRETLVEMHSKKVGFHDCKVRGNQLLLNGVPITLKGINRHEYDPRNGRTISVELIESELKMIKAHNMNAIRCSHYPNHPAFYEIASELGIYVMDEADLETHGCGVTGDQGYLAKQPEWQKAFVDRVIRMAERDKNETCVMIWSTGNEHGSGENIDACAFWLKGFRRKLPVYRAVDDAGYPLVNEFRYNGYFSYEQLISYPEEGEPVILIEYGHGMGNSPGLMEDTWDYVYTHRHITGGYVWEFKNHGFYREDEKGSPFYQYGGDFGDVNHWSNFSMDGYCLSDGTAKPSLRDCKNVLAPTYVTYDGNAIRLMNTNDFRDLSYITLKWEFCEDFHVLRQGEYRLPAIRPYESMILDMDTTVDMRTAGAKYMVNLKFYDGAEEIAFKQVVLKDCLPGEAYQKMPRLTEVKEAGNDVEIIGQGYLVEIKNGLLCKYVKDNRTLLDAPMRFNIFRAPTDNDGVVGWSPRWIAKWEERLLPYFEFWPIETKIRKEMDCVTVSVKGIWAPTGRYIGFRTEIEYRIMNEGFVLVEIVGKPYGDFCEVLPRIGVCFEVSSDFRQVSWYGRGVEENYCDRKAHCNFGYYSLPVEEMNFLYDIPQECGTRTETSFVKVANKGCGLAIIGSNHFSFAYHDFTQEALTRARHRNELEKADKNYLYIDYRMRGLGSHSCGPNPEECYELRAHDFRFVFALTAETDEEKLLSLSRADFGVKTERLSENYVREKVVEEANVIECDVNRE